MPFHHTILDNGLEIIAETKPEAQSAAVGFLVKTGARDETPEINGVSHFLEHMAFKGDDRHSAEDVNRIFDEIGASYNASTGEEVTFYHAAILPEYLETAFDLMATLMRPSLREADFEMEKQVILEEIGMYQDLPSFLIYEKAMGVHFAGHPLGQCILGTPESITALTSGQMRAYHETRYGARNIVLAAAGNFDFDKLVELAKSRCGSWSPGVPGRCVSEASPVASETWERRKQLNQQHVMRLAPAPPAQSPLRYAAEMIAMIVGDDGSGRIYWDLVETGRAETADVGYNDYDGSGLWTTYLCSSPEQTGENLHRIDAILEEFNQSGPTRDELERARNKVLSRIVLSNERPMGRLYSLAGNWAYRSEYRSVTDDLNAIRDLTFDDLMQVLTEYPLAGTTTVGLGPLEGISHF